MQHDRATVSGDYPPPPAGVSARSDRIPVMPMREATGRRLNDSQKLPGPAFEADADDAAVATQRVRQGHPTWIGVPKLGYLEIDLTLSRSRSYPVVGPGALGMKLGSEERPSPDAPC